MTYLGVPLHSPKLAISAGVHSTRGVLRRNLRVESSAWRASRLPEKDRSPGLEAGPSANIAQGDLAAKHKTRQTSAGALTMLLRKTLEQLCGWLSRSFIVAPGIHSSYNYCACDCGSSPCERRGTLAVNGQGASGERPVRPASVGLAGGLRAGLALVVNRAADLACEFRRNLSEIVRGPCVFGSFRQHLFFGVATSFERTTGHQVIALENFSHHAPPARKRARWMLALFGEPGVEK